MSRDNNQNLCPDEYSVYMWPQLILISFITSLKSGIIGEFDPHFTDNKAFKNGIFEKLSDLYNLSCLVNDGI